VGRNEAGNRVGVQITAPEGFDASGAVVTIGDKTYDDLFTAEKNYFWWYPLVSEAGETFTATVKWNDESTQVFTVKISEEASLADAPAEPVKGSIAWDPGKTGGDDLTVSVEGNTITFDGNIEWYPADPDVGRNEAGNRVGVQITAPEGFDASGAVVTIGDKTYDDLFTAEKNYFWWYPLVSEAGETFTATVKWNDESTQVFTVKISEEASLADAPAEPVKGSIAWDPGKTGGDDLTVSVEGNTITFDGNIEWYPADPDVGRNEAGNRVGVQITAPEGFDASGAVVTIGDKTYDDLFTAEKNYFWWYPLVSEAGETFTATVKWNEASEQTFTVKIADTATLEKAPVEEVEADFISTGDVGIAPDTAGEAAGKIYAEYKLVANEEDISLAASNVEYIKVKVGEDGEWKDLTANTDATLMV
jgi:hypothetical protein